ncbi:leucine-rich repeat domain-containing protein [Listeria innocua]|nr:leucine-rich repeat domain-containing protein [Listeria innocua]EIS4930860.1 leucine-rich repeat domain-containing protein [Listeria innocua]EIS4933203.1 leucine-rich repeat domain-containing protein [Listeria innocua]EIS4942557.1 leucine-rich repeat domain-containing protein [Listeria innocua]EIS4944692.1 leucine-rich repeat domain-containing protein [Listeria innocua]
MINYMKKALTISLLVVSLVLISFISAPNANAAEKSILPSPKPINEIFPDENMAKVIAEVTYKSSSTAEVSQTDLDKVIKLDGSTSDRMPGPIIYSIEGVEYLQNLMEFNISGQSVSNISPLEGLSNLETVYISENNINDLSPLSKSPKIKILDASNNNISDISTLSSLPNLNSVRLNNNSISNISVLKDFPANQFVYIYLADNKIKDISPLAGKSFQQLTLNNNEISDISPLSKMTLYSEDSLTDNFYIDISNNHISDISSLKNADLGKLDYFFAEDQSIINQPKAFSTNFTLENKVKNINGTPVTPQNISNSGSYSNAILSWQLPSFVANLDYSFSETTQIGRSTGEFSGKVTQSLVDGYSVTFDNEGTLSTRTFASDELVTEPAKPSKTGFTFTGWYDAKTGGKKWDFTTDRMPANNITLYAQYEELATDPVSPVDPTNPTDPVKLDETINAEESGNMDIKEEQSETTTAIENATALDDSKQQRALPKTGDTNLYLVLIGLLFVGLASLLWKKKQV